MPERMIRSGAIRALVPNICLACLILVSALAADALPPPDEARVTVVEAVPNPFNPTTVVAFRIEGPDGGSLPVRVEIFDLRGRRVATLLDASLPPGDHSVDWAPEDGSKASDAMVFARVTAGTHAGVVKLVRLD